jgi:curved DNA-binding protein
VSHYQTLGVDKTAPQAEIKKAYRKLSMQHHPDKGGDTKRFQEIADAYAILGNESKRAEYDAVGENPFGNMFNNMGGMDGNFSDLFNNVFGQQQRQRQQKGTDVRVDMHITFMESFTGCSKRFNLNGEDHSIYLKAGVKTGQKFRLRGKGQAHPFNTQLPSGDLIVIIHVQMSPEYIIDQNNDVWIDVTLPWYDIMAGTKITIDTLDGPISITVAEDTTPGKVLRIKERGWPNYDTQLRGSLMVKLNPSYPELNETQLEYIKKVGINTDGKIF